MRAKPFLALSLRQPGRAKLVAGCVVVEA